MLSPPDYSHDFFIYLAAHGEGWYSFGSGGWGTPWSCHILFEPKPYWHRDSLFSCQEAWFSYHTCGSAVETLYSHSPDLGCSPCQSVSIHPHLKDDWGKYNKWIVILQEFDLEFVSEKLKKSLIFAKLISDFPREMEELVCEDMFIDEHIFLISTLDPWYGNIIIYLQSLKVPTHLS